MSRGPLLDFFNFGPELNSWLTLFKQMQVAAFQSMDSTPVVFIQTEGSDGVIHYLPAEALSMKIEVTKT